MSRRGSQHVRTAAQRARVGAFKRAGAFVHRCWLHWPQLKVPLDEETRLLVSSLDIDEVLPIRNSRSLQSSAPVTAEHFAAASSHCVVHFMPRKRAIHCAVSHHGG